MDAQARKFRHKAEELRVTARRCHSGSASHDILKIAAQYEELAAVLERRLTAALAETALFLRH